MPRRNRPLKCTAEKFVCMVKKKLLFRFRPGKQDDPVLTLLLLMFCNAQHKYSGADTTMKVIIRKKLNFFVMFLMQLLISGIFGSVLF